MSLRVDQLSKVYSSAAGEHVVFRDLTFATSGPAIIAVYGPNGCGKTTLANVLAGLTPPTIGTISRSARHPADRAAYMFQNYSYALLPWLTLRENILLPLRLQRASRATCEELMHDLAGSLAIDGLPLSRYPFQASGGQQQRACLARALITTSTLLIVDEPFSNLDSATKLKALAALERYHTANQAVVVVITHDLDDAILLADRVLVLGGAPTRIVGDVTVELARPRLPAFALTEDFARVRRSVLAVELAFQSA